MGCWSLSQPTVGCRWDTPRMVLLESPNQPTMCVFKLWEEPILARGKHTNPTQLGFEPGLFPREARVLITVQTTR